MNNSKLVILYDEKKLIFTFESNDFKITDCVSDNTIFSSYFKGIDIKFSDDEYTVNEEVFKYNMNNSNNQYNFIVYKDVSYTTYVVDGVALMGNDDHCDILLKIDNELIFERKKDEMYIYCSGEVLVNKQIRTGRFKVFPGDYIFIGNELIFVTKTGLKIRNEVSCKLIEDISMNSNINYNSYHRSPRLFNHINRDTIKIVPPPNKKNKEDTSIVKLIIPPLIMLSITVGYQY